MSNTIIEDLMRKEELKHDSNLAYLLAEGFRAEYKTASIRHRPVFEVGIT